MKLGEPVSGGQRPVGWRLAVAVTLFGLSILSFVTGGVLLASDLPASWKGPAALLIFPIPELLDLTAVAVVGKQGFWYLKGLLFGSLRQRVAQEVSRTRYRIGLVMFLLPVAFGWLAPYLAHNISGFSEHALIFHVGGDVLFLASLFVLGGDFWDKLGAMFSHNAKAVFPQ